MNGYAVIEQTSVGIHRRQYARAFVFAEDANPDKRTVLVVADMGLMFQSIFMEVLRRLKKKFGDMYRQDNVVIQATHTHVAPGGTSQHLLVDITTAGFRPRTFEAVVAGIVAAIERAHNSLAPAELTLAEATVEDAGRNRSKKSFDRNPEADKAEIPDGVDKRSVTLHINRDGKNVGFINWYSIHPTSFPFTYKHISSDNKGYAAWATEEAAGVDHQHPEDAPFVAAFAQGTPGDITPNHGLVPGSGPGETPQDSARILGERMMAAVDDTSKGTSVTNGGVRSIFRWVDCANLSVDAKWTADGKPGKTGPAILGAAFAASSQEDGGGDPILGFQEGERGGTPWVAAVNKVTVPANVKAIQEPKEMLLPVGYIPGLIQQTHTFSINRIGGLTLVALGFEPTVTSGLRLRRTVAEALGVPANTVVVQGYTNGYGHYITTPEEYEGQDYEGGATVFGRNQLPAFHQVFHDMAVAMKEGRSVEVGKPAGDLTGLIPKSIAADTWEDIPPIGKKFGDVIEAPKEVSVGTTFDAVFVGASPNNNLRPGEGYLSIIDSNGKVIANDSSESTLLTFENKAGKTTSTITWETTGATPGKYTIELRGDSKALFGALTPFAGRCEVTVN